MKSIDLNELQKQCLKVHSAILNHQMIWEIEKAEGKSPSGNPFLADEIRGLQRLLKESDNNN